MRRCIRSLDRLLARDSRLPASGFCLIFLSVLMSAACQSGPGRALERLEPCRLEDGPPDTYCGHLTVFEDRQAKRGRAIRLKIVVAPALRRDAQPDPLFVFEGGPGGGAATLAFSRVPMFRRFQRDRDIVLVDQRGTGGSNPLDCSPEVPRDVDDLSTLDDDPTMRYRACLERLDADPRLYTTELAMDDIDDVRVHLGYDRINVWGGSYGTRAALVYLKRHDGSVRSVVLDGVAPTDMRLPLYAARDSQRALDRLIDDCSRDPVCAREFPSLKQSVATLWERLAARPKVTVTHPRTGMPAEVTMTPRLAGSVVFTSLYSPEVSALLPRLLTDASEGRFQGLLALAFTRDSPKGAMSDGLYLSVVCAEDRPRITAEDIARESQGRFMGAMMFETQMRPCEFWPRGAVADEYYAPVTSTRPVLILSGENDPVTPPSWGEGVARHLPNARHIVVPGAGHITLTRGCVPELVSAFLATADVTTLDPRCVETLRRPPFFATYSGPERP